MSDVPHQAHFMNAYLPDPWDDGLVHELYMNDRRNDSFRWRVACQMVLLSDDNPRFKKTDESVNCMRCMLCTPNQGTKR